MCSTLMFGTLKLGLIDLQSAPLTKSETPIPPPPKYKVMYPEDASVWSVKISSVHKIVLQGLCQNVQPYKVLVKKLHFHLVISVCF
jgi:hypothetical protein